MHWRIPMIQTLDKTDSKSLISISTFYVLSQHLFQVRHFLPNNFSNVKYHLEVSLERTGCIVWFQTIDKTKSWLNQKSSISTSTFYVLKQHLFQVRHFLTSWRQTRAVSRPCAVSERVTSPLTRTYGHFRLTRDTHQLLARVSEQQRIRPGSDIGLSVWLLRNGV